MNNDQNAMERATSNRQTAGKHGIQSLQLSEREQNPQVDKPFEAHVIKNQNEQYPIKVSEHCFLL